MCEPGFLSWRDIFSSFLLSVISVLRSIDCVTSNGGSELFLSSSLSFFSLFCFLHILHSTGAREKNSGRRGHPRLGRQMMVTVVVYIVHDLLRAGWVDRFEWRTDDMRESIG